MTDIAKIQTRNLGVFNIDANGQIDRIVIVIENLRGEPIVLTVAPTHLTAVLATNKLNPEKGTPMGYISLGSA